MAARPANDAPPQRTKGLLKRKARTARIASIANAARSAAKAIMGVIASCPNERPLSPPLGFKQSGATELFPRQKTGLPP
jgi:hypothetical protein